jgi:multimeric flavodoxin WrbA
MSILLGINGSPRKNGNTTAMLQHALNGAESKGASTELINLYDLSFKGCVSCFACKRSGSARSKRCAYKDALTPVLEKLEKADALILGSPVYVGDLTGETRSFIERFMFPQISYEEGPHSYFKKKLSVGVIATMGATLERAQEMGFTRAAESVAQWMKAIFGSGEIVLATDTLQFDDYSKYAASHLNPEDKKKIHNEQFPKDCAAAFEMGARFAVE